MKRSKVEWILRTLCAIIILSVGIRFTILNKGLDVRQSLAFIILGGMFFIFQDATDRIFNEGEKDV